jgi:hypothetical protein
MSVSVASIGHPGQVLQLQKSVAGEGQAPVAVSTASVSSISTNSAQSLTALASFLTQLGSDTGAGPSSGSSSDPLGGDGTDTLLNQLESDLKSLFSDLQSPRTSSNASAPSASGGSAADSLLSNLESSFKTLFPGLPQSDGSATTATGDSGDSLLASLENDLKSLFADLQAPGKSDGGQGWASASHAGSDATRLAKVIDAYAAETGTSDGTQASSAA